MVVAVLAFMGAAGFIVVSSLSGDKDANDAEATSQNITGQSSDPANQAPSTTNSVTIRDFSFGPSKITVKKGTTVTWTNEDGVNHDVTPTNESAAFEGSDLFGKGESYSFTFNAVGNYSYYCSPHPYMKGTVEVVE